MILKRISFCLCLLLAFTQCARKNYYQADARYAPGPEDKLDPPPAGYVWAVIGPQYQKGRLHQLVWGRHYRKVWAAPVAVKELDLRHVQGGLQPQEMGGGLQTTSLTLKAPDGRLYTLRTLDKDPSKSLPAWLRKTFVANMMRDQTSAVNPYAAFTLPPLARAAGILHTNPQLYYVPRADNHLGSYSDAFAGKVVMLEEKFKGKASLVPALAGASDIVDSHDMFKNRFKSSRYQVDQQAFAKARLFDVLISDWDRHEGQWNWLAYRQEANGQVVYLPFPKDRDYAYYRFTDGLLPWLTTRKPLARMVKSFRHNVPDVAGLVYKSRFLDHRLLNEVTADEWMQIATDMKKTFTPELLAQSVSLFPDTVYQLEGARTLARLQQRVDRLPELAGDFYKLLARRVTVAGSDDREKFLVKRIDDHATSVEVQSLPDSPKEKPRQLYYRVFSHLNTRELTLHGLGEDDEFVVEGRATRGIRINIYGGLGADKITDSSRVKKGRDKTFVYDTRRGNELHLGKEAKDKTTTDIRIHAYDREGF